MARVLFENLASPALVRRRSFNHDGDGCLVRRIADPLQQLRGVRLMLPVADETNDPDLVSVLDVDRQRRAAAIDDDNRLVAGVTELAAKVVCWFWFPIPMATVATLAKKRPGNRWGVGRLVC